MATENKKINNPVINVLTQAQYNSITNPNEDEFYLITDDIAQVANGGTGLASLTAGSVLVGNGANPVTLKAIDTTVGGTSNSTDLITSGAVYSGLNENKLPLQKGTGTNSLMHINANSASGDYSFAEGNDSQATGDYSHAEGKYTKANGEGSHAEGAGTQNTSTGVIFYTLASGSASHAEGGGTTASGDNSHAEGGSTTASGAQSHAEGGNTKAEGDNSHAEGSGCRAIEANAHAEGAGTLASGSSSHAEGGGTTASGGCAHAEGGATTASGEQSHAEGAETTASGYSSHAEGNGTTANHKAQHAFGEYNIEDSSVAEANKRGTYVEIVGNGTLKDKVITRSNARTLDWSGNEVLSGTLTSTGLKIGNVLSNGIDTTTGGTSTSTNLITSGAVYDGLAQKSDGVIIRTWS